MMMLIENELKHLTNSEEAMQKKKNEDQEHFQKRMEEILKATRKKLEKMKITMEDV